ncbi:hypothetical protein OS493_021747 [Desmophyllum pertusum]|uniref:Uncharacterized protein n=1 Tax=Desmophyllum pertusum TaxID=174260 RepID=A0A9X0A104_9CNID|nr:hypothetical protein OS493_021747 [Desmophyllum pertusum]
MSKKSKKQKAKPGECMYADLGDFNQMREMPKVSTSPQPLPPFKKPSPYGETEYADITQFLKEGAKLPGGNNSQGQATETDSNSQGQAALANSNSSQGPATDTKNTGADGKDGRANNESCL